MRLSAKAEYACLAVIFLAQQGADPTPVRVREIAEAHGIPERYLIHILLQLKAAGLVDSTRGATGGYRLARPAERISLGEVLSAIDPPDRPSRTALEPAAQILASALEHARIAELTVLSQITIAELAGQAPGHDWII